MTAPLSQAAKDLGVEFVELDDLFARSDVLGLQMPLIPFNTGIINRENIAKMKDGVIIINNSRGQMVVELIPAVSPVRIQSPLPSTGETRERLAGHPLSKQRRPVGQVVKTRPFHGCNMGSSPVRVTTSAIRKRDCRINGGLAQLVRAPASHAGKVYFFILPSLSHRPWYPLLLASYPAWRGCRC